MRTVAEKLGVKAGISCILMHAPAGIFEELSLPEVALKKKLQGAIDYIHLFVKNEAEFHEQFPKAKEHLKEGGMLWLSWPKAGKMDTDLTLTRIIKIGYDYGLVESKVVSINDTWSAIKFTHPKKGKEYNNSYGSLK